MGPLRSLLGRVGAKVAEAPGLLLWMLSSLLVGRIVQVLMSLSLGVGSGCTNQRTSSQSQQLTLGSGPRSSQPLALPSHTHTILLPMFALLE